MYVYDTQTWHSGMFSFLYTSFKIPTIYNITGSLCINVRCKALVLMLNLSPMIHSITVKYVLKFWHENFFVLFVSIVTYFGDSRGV